MSPRITKKSEQLVQGWINFWQKRGSLFLENYTIPFHPDISNTRTNLFFTINGYKPLSKNRKENNIEKFNCFYFDIDQKDNPDISKILLQVKILSYSYFFDFIVESRNGYHLYILLPDGKYTSKEEYLMEWKNKAEELEGTMDIHFDKNIFDTTRISRIPGSFHQKPGNVDYFSLKLIKGEDILFPQYEKLNNINNISITEVLDTLGVKYSGNTIHTEDGLPTNGYKINIEDNYIIDFSHSRPEGEPFAFVKGYYTQKIMKESGKKDEGLTMGMTYNFFRDYFGIIGSIESSKKIIVKEYIEKFISEEFESKEQYIIYAIMGYYQKKNSGGILLGKKIQIDIAEMIENLSLTMTVKKVVDILNKIISEGKTILGSYIFLSGFILKEKKKYIFKGVVLPEWNLIRNRREFFISHYIPFSIFQLSHKNTDLSFYLILCKSFLSQKKQAELTIEKIFLSQQLLQDYNFSRVFKRIQKIQYTTGNFYMKKYQREIVFSKRIILM